MNDAQIWVEAIKGLSLTVILICAVAYVIGKIADALKARWSK